MIYEQYFGYDLFNISLAPLEVCREMHEEAKQALKKDT